VSSLIAPETRPEPRRLLDAAARGPVVLDAAMGTRLISLGLDLGSDDPSFWNLSHPEAVAGVHALDVAAGADAVLTNTFGANRCWLGRSGRAAETVAINRRAAEIARQAVGPGRFVIGSVGPTAASDPVAVREQAEALAEAGVDALVFETHLVESAAAALRSVRPSGPLPIIVSLARWPEPVGPALRLLEDFGASVVGGNCQPGMGPALGIAERLRPLTGLFLWVKPSAGLPGQPAEDPASFASAVPTLLAQGVRFLGGCCGTTDAHVAALRAACYALSR
jgi:methionine synthase I (cobalamin-dependent)